jgi:hypothetical protein
MPTMAMDIVLAQTVTVAEVTQAVMTAEI